MDFAVEEAQKNRYSFSQFHAKNNQYQQNIRHNFTVFKKGFISVTLGIVRNNEQLNTTKNLMHAIRQLYDHASSAILFQGSITKYIKRDFCCI